MSGNSTVAIIAIPNASLVSGSLLWPFLRISLSQPVSQPASRTNQPTTNQPTYRPVGVTSQIIYISLRLSPNETIWMQNAIKLLNVMLAAATTTTTTTVCEYARNSYKIYNLLLECATKTRILNGACCSPWYLILVVAPTSPPTALSPPIISLSSSRWVSKLFIALLVMFRSC